MASQEIISPLVKEAPAVDGAGNDAAWQAANTYIIHDKRRDKDIILKSVHTDDMVFFYVQYPDDTENKLQKPWVWNKEMEIYTIGPQREDTFMFRWNMGEKDVDLSNYSDDTFTADIWYWKSHRSNPVGYADDKYHILSDTEAKKSRMILSPTAKKRYLLRLADAGTPMYRKNIEIEYKGDIIPQYSYVTPTGSRADVRAKGRWENGAWTIEFGRKLNTGHGDDVQFKLNAGKKYLFGVSIASLYGEPIDDTVPNLYGQGRISEPLYLILE
jgi:hypothetical protein